MRLVLLCLLLALVAGPVGADGTTMRRSLQVGEQARQYVLHLPDGFKPGEHPPLVLVLHGGGGRASTAMRQLGFNELADREGFLVAYPEGIEHHWNDGREDPYSRAAQDKVDDVAFIRALIATLKGEFGVDPARVYATGPSNGGMMCHRLGAELSDEIVAIAPVIGGLAGDRVEALAPTHPVSVLMIQSRDDPWVPYGGGEVRVMGGRARGSVAPTEAVAAQWANANGCKVGPELQALEQNRHDDGCRAESRRWSGGRGGSEVVLISVQGAGHTWPGGVQYLPEQVVGKVCRDLEATATVWDFFKGHPRRP